MIKKLKECWKKNTTTVITLMNPDSKEVVVLKRINTPKNHMNGSKSHGHNSKVYKNSFCYLCNKIMYDGEKYHISCMPRIKNIQKNYQEFFSKKIPYGEDVFLIELRRIKNRTEKLEQNVKVFFQEKNKGMEHQYMLNEELPFEKHFREILKSFKILDILIGNNIQKKYPPPIQLSFKAGIHELVKYICSYPHWDTNKVEKCFIESINDIRFSEIKKEEKKLNNQLLKIQRKRSLSNVSTLKHSKSYDD